MSSTTRVWIIIANVASSDSHADFHFLMVFLFLDDGRLTQSVHTSAILVSRIVLASRLGSADRVGEVC